MKVIETTNGAAHNKEYLITYPFMLYGVGNFAFMPLKFPYRSADGKDQWISTRSMATFYNSHRVVSEINEPDDIQDVPNYKIVLDMLPHTDPYNKYSIWCFATALLFSIISMVLIGYMFNPKQPEPVVLDNKFPRVENVAKILKSLQGDISSWRDSYKSLFVDLNVFHQCSYGCILSSESAPKHLVPMIHELEKAYRNPGSVSPDVPFLVNNVLEYMRHI